MDDHTPFEQPLNPLPPVVIVLAVIIVLVEARAQLGTSGLTGDPAAIGWRLAWLQKFSLNPEIFNFIIMRGDYSLDLIVRFVSYPFVHRSFIDALFGAALTLALGKFVGEQFGGWRTLVLFVCGGIAGAVIFCLLAPAGSPLYGASPPIYALIGGFTYLIWLRLGAVGANQFAAFRLIGFLLGIQLVFGMLFGAGDLWIAELGAFAFGFGISTVLAPGGWAQLLERLRERS